MPESDIRIRRLVNAIFRTQGPLRQYFTDIFPYIREAVAHFGLEDLWKRVYAAVVTGDFEIDRAALFLDALYSKDKPLFASFIEYVLTNLHKRFRVDAEDLERFLRELKTLGFVWSGKKVVPLRSAED